MNVSHKDIPIKKDMGKFYQIAFRPKTTSEGKETGYVFVQPEDLDYIFHWLNRFLTDAASHSIAEKFVWDSLNKEGGMEGAILPKSGSFTDQNGNKTQNSIISYIGGILSNYFRSGADLNKKQLKTLTDIFNKIVVEVYTHVNTFTPGYNYTTRQPAPGPKRISFKVH